ncbi:MAG: Stk1 family PASTA domain-containing Ser/Thr kinase [bacterium]
MTEPRLVGNRYELGALLGYGGMAEVHLGRDVRLGRQVALKIMRTDLARDPSFQSRFRREAQSAGGLNHPSIVAVYDTGEDHIGDTVVPYIVMEYVDGRTLREILTSEKRLDSTRAMEIVSEVCAALDFSHRHGIIHRDIKPANVMITRAGAVKVMDFGIARAVADEAATMTQTAAVIGTAQYLSPEQARGETVDARSDVYSTGCLLYELVTGSPPFQGDSPVAVAYQHVRESAAVPSTVNPAVPRTLDSIVMKALAKNPLNRYQSAADMRADLQRAIADRPVSAEPVLSDEERTQLLRPRGAAGLAAGAAAGAAGAATVANLPPRRPGDSGVVPLGEDGDDPRSGRRTALIWTAVVLALLLVIGGTAYALLRSGDKQKAAPPVETTQVPNLVGLTQPAAAGRIKTNKLALAAPVESLRVCAVPTVQKGQVCTQNPDPGGVVNVNTSVTIAIFIGLEQVPVPALTKYPDALTQITKAGFAVGTFKAVNDRKPAGTVTKQNPSPGESADKGSKISFDYSTGQLVIPDVGGKSFSDGSAALNQRGFLNVRPNPETVPNNDPKRNGTIVRTSPASGSLVDVKREIVIFVYADAPPPVTCTTPPPTPTPPTSPASTSPTGTTATGTTPAPTPTPTPTPTKTPSRTGLPPCPA